MESEGTEDDQVDPIAGMGVMKAATSEGAKETTRLLGRVLGPSADVIGEALARYTEQRMRNVGRVVAKADEKSGGRTGEVHARVAHRLLEEGSYCDEELMAEYLGGVLAAARVPGGRDDRAVVWSEIVTGMSSLQVRAHMILYREWAAALKGRDDVNPGTHEGRQRARMLMDLHQFYLSVKHDTHDGDPNAVIAHSVLGLIRLGLLEDEYRLGPTHNVAEAPEQWQAALVVKPSVMGIELYGWACGDAEMTALRFVSDAELLALDEVPRPSRVLHPGLSPIGGSELGR